MGRLRMNEQDKIKNHLESVGHDLESWEGVQALVIHNLSNFAYRFISTENDPAPKIEVKDQSFSARSIERNLVAALKIGGAELKNDLITMAREKGKDATVGTRIVVEIKDFNPRGAISCVLRAGISWDHPEHSYQKNFKEKTLKVTFEEPLDMRNKLALALDQICAYF